MRERPILFSAPMVRAILEGRKTQTRRVVSFKSWPECDHVSTNTSSDPEVSKYGEFLIGQWYDSEDAMCVMGAINCPSGKPGDRLWLREAWKAAVGLDALSGKQIGEKALSAGYKKPWAPMTYLADGRVVHGEVMRPGTGEFGTEFGRYRHPRFMPRWASRILLEITDLRVQRLQEISEEDALAEGIPPECDGDDLRPYALAFGGIWKHINGEESWDANPWVWAITFKQIEAAERAA